VIASEAAQCVARLRKAQGNKEGLSDAKVLSELHQELSSLTKRIHDHSQRTALFRAEGVKVTVLPQLGQVQQAVQNLAARFSEKPAVTTLKQGKRWTNLTGSLEDLAEQLQKALDDNWRTYVATALFAGAPPDQLRLPKTPANEAALRTYSQLFRTFSQLRLKAPADKAQFSVLRDLSKKLGAVSFQTDVPPEVKKFLDATATDQGAAIGLLTDSVRTWLKDHDLLGQYVIRSKVG
jgi:hypothetical protein